MPAASVTGQKHDRAVTIYSCWLTGKVIKTSYSDHSKDTTEGKRPTSLLMGWCELRNGLADYVPATTVELGRRFSHLKQHHDHATVHFRSGTSIDAKIVVGADGIFSKVRQQTLHDGLPHFIVSQNLPFAVSKGLCACCHLVPAQRRLLPIYNTPRSPPPPHL